MKIAGRIVKRGTLAMSANSFMPQKKEWVVSAALGAASLVSSLLGGAASSKAAKEAQEAQKKANMDERATLLRRRHEDYLDTAAGQNLVRKARELADRDIKRTRGAAAMGGGTDASVALAKQGANKVVSDAVAEIGARDTSRKEQIDTQLAENTRRAGEIKANEAIRRGQATAQVAGAASNALATGAAIAASGAGSKAKSGTENTGASEGTTGGTENNSPISDLNPSYKMDDYFEQYND